MVVDHDKVTNAYSEASSIMHAFKAQQPAVTLSFTNGVTLSGSSHWVMNKYREFEDKLKVQRVEGDPEVSRNRNSAPTIEEMPADFFNNLAPKKAVNPNTGRPITLYVVTEKSLEGLNYRDAKGQAVARLNEQSPSVGLSVGDVIDLSGQMSQTLTIKESDLIPAKRHQSSDQSFSM